MVRRVTLRLYEIRRRAPRLPCASLLFAHFTRALPAPAMTLAGRRAYRRTAPRNAEVQLEWHGRPGARPAGRPTCAMKPSQIDRHLLHGRAGLDGRSASRSPSSWRGVAGTAGSIRPATRRKLSPAYIERPHQRHEGARLSPEWTRSNEKICSGAILPHATNQGTIFFNHGRALGARWFCTFKAGWSPAAL